MGGASSMAHIHGRSKTHRNISPQSNKRRHRFDSRHQGKLHVCTTPTAAVVLEARLCSALLCTPCVDISTNMDEIMPTYYATMNSPGAQI